MAKML